jgi:Flp pilus assembly secretin CpaC
MIRRPFGLFDWKRFICTALFAFAFVGQPATCDAQPEVRYLAIQTGHSMVLPVKDLRRVAVGDADCLGVVAIGRSQLVLNGKAPGHTSLFVWNGGTRATYEVIVSSQVVDSVTEMLRSAISEPDVQVVSFGRAVIVRGSVEDMAAYLELGDVLSHFSDYARENKYSIVNAVRIARSMHSIQRDFASVSGVSGLQIEPDGKGNIIVTGHVPDDQVGQRVLTRAQTLAGTSLGADGKVIDRLEVTHSTQIDIKVYVLEVDHTAMKNLGVQLQSATFHPDGTYTVGSPSFPVVENAEPPGAALKIGAFFRTVTLAPTLNLLIQEGHARVLSAPDILTAPGAPATFLVGGQIPIPFSTGLGQTSIVYKDFGVQLNVTPTLQANGTIAAQIQPDISDLDFQDGVNQNGFLVPALKESRLSTKVITKPGQSVVMGGMLRHVEQRVIQKVPVLGDIPILGKLFSSTSYQNNQTDVVFVMTPEITNQ